MIKSDIALVGLAVMGENLASTSNKKVIGYHYIIDCGKTVRKR